MKNLHTYNTFKVNEELFGFKNKKHQIEYKEENDFCKEFNDIGEMIKFAKEFFNIKYISVDDIPFNIEEKKKFALFSGVINYIYDKNSITFEYKFQKTIGFGLSNKTITKYYFNISKKLGNETNDVNMIVGNDKGYIRSDRSELFDGDKYYYIMTMFVDNKVTGGYNKYYLCNNIDTCIDKIKEIKNKK